MYIYIYIFIDVCVCICRFTKQMLAFLHAHTHTHIWPHIGVALGQERFQLAHYDAARVQGSHFSLWEG